MLTCRLAGEPRLPRGAQTAGNRGGARRPVRRPSRQGGGRGRWHRPGCGWTRGEQWSPLDSLMVWVWGVRKRRVRKGSKVWPEQLEGWRADMGETWEG